MSETPSSTLPVMDEKKIAESTVLIVDDNAQNLELLVAYLDSLGCKVVTATDGLEALEKVRQGPCRWSRT